MILPSEGGMFGDILLGAIARFPDRIALIEEGGTALSYRALGVRIAQALDGFRAIGLRPGDAIAQLAGNSANLYATIVAIYVGGYRSVTLHALGGFDDHAFILTDAGAKLLIADRDHLERARMLEAAGTPLLCHEEGEGVGHFWTLGRGDAPLPNHAAGSAEDIVRLAYTGGTTGRPKGVMLSNRSLTVNALIALGAIAWPGEIRFLCPAPISHGAGSFVAPMLARGGTVMLQRGFDAQRFRAAARAWRPTVTWLVPTMVAALLESPEGNELASLETLIWSAAPMPAPLLEKAIARFGPILVQCYGQTEAPNVILVMPGDEQAARPEAAGRPPPGIDVALLAENGDRVDAPGSGAIGEICVRGPLVMSGYWRQPEATAAAFAHGWLHTGDLGTIDADGSWRIVGRKKDMIISGGFNVFPREVEDVLAALPGVAAACVFGIPDDKWGEKVVALVVAAPGATPDPDALAAAVRAAKGPIQTPKTIALVDAIPLTAVGKPDKQALRRRWLDPGAPLAALDTVG